MTTIKDVLSFLNDLHLCVGASLGVCVREDAVQVLARVLFFGTRLSFKAQLVGRGGRLSEILATRMFLLVLAAAPPHVGKKQLPCHYYFALSYVIQAP